MTAAPPPSPPDARRVVLVSRCRLASIALVSLAALLALAPVTGWLFGITALTGGAAGAVTMSLGTALVLVMTTGAVAVQVREGMCLSPSRLLLAAAGVALLLVGWSLVELATGWSLGGDAVFAATASGPASALASPPALLPLVGAALLIGATVLAGHPSRYGATQALALGAASVALFDVTGALVAVTPADLGATTDAMSGPAALVLLVLSAGLLLSQPERGLVARLTHSDAQLLRRVLPLFVLLPVGAAWLVWEGVQAAVYSPAVGAALLATFAALAPAALLLVGTRSPARQHTRDATTAERTHGGVAALSHEAITAIPLPVLVHDGDTIIHANRAWSELAGTEGPPQATTLSNWFTDVQPSSVEALPAWRERLATSTSSVRELDVNVPVSDGSERCYELWTSTLAPSDDTRRVYVTTAVDVTGRRAAEAALRQTREDLERRAAERTAELTRANDALKRQSDQLREQTLLLDLVREGILVRDLYGTIVYWNHGAATMYGWPKEQALGKVSHQLLATEYPIPVAEIEQEVMRTGFWEGDVVHVTRTGTRLVVESRWTLTRTERGRPEGFLEVHRDITQRRESERVLQERNDALARSNHELEQFAYVASHDLQEPLRMVSNYTQLLARRYRDQLDADANEFIDFAVDGARRMQELIHDLLQYARVDRHARELRPVAFDTVVGGALSNLAGAIADVNASVVVDALPTLVCDGPQMTQVLQNLIGNAIKFRRPDQAPVVRVSAVREVGAWRFLVADNGIGIEPRYFERIFQMFQRLHPRGEYPGTGIGLSLCKKIVERHGGRMRVESAPGHGATFSFTVPDVIPAREIP